MERTKRQSLAMSLNRGTPLPPQKRTLHQFTWWVVGGYYLFLVGQDGVMQTVAESPPKRGAVELGGGSGAGFQAGH